MLRSYLRLLRENRNYRLLWFAQVVSELGDWFYALAVYNLLLELTGNRAQAVGLAVVLQVLPHTLVAPATGVINDRISRRAIMIGADIGRFFIVLGMLGVRTPGMVWMVYPLLFLETIGAAFFEPAHSAVIPNIVPESGRAAGQRAGVDHLVLLPRGGSVAGRHRGGAAGARRGVPAECVLVPRLGVADRADEFRGAAHGGARAVARARPRRLLPDSRGPPLHPRRPPSLRDGVREGRHRLAGRQ